MLHLIFHPPYDISVFQRIALGDDVIFFENTLFKLYQGSELSETITTLSKQSINFYVLEDDIKCRGIYPDQLILNIEVIDYSQLVSLTKKNKVIQTWR